MSLSERLALPPPALEPAIPALNLLESAARRILSRWPDIKPVPEEKDQERLIRELQRRILSDDWQGATWSFAIAAGWATFDRFWRDRAEMASLREFYCREIRASKRLSFLSAMLEIYLQTYAPGARHTRELAAALSEAGPRFSKPDARLLTNFPQLLDPLEAHEALAARMIEAPDAWKGLKAMGLKAPHAPGLTQRAHILFVQKLKPELKTRRALEKLFRWLTPEGREPLRPGANPSISAVMGHWTQAEPPDEDRRFIVENLIAAYGDPRLNPGAPWSEVADQERAVLLRWITGENISLFLEIAAEVEPGQAWEARKDFWLGLHDHKRIDAAWVAFSGPAVELAQRLTAEGRGRDVLRFGVQKAGGRLAEISLLIMKIGDKIVVEGSHDYKIHIFPQNHRLAPKLYQPTYDCETIRMAIGAESRPHLGDWQDWALERI
jgi:hypothetical protein